MGIGLPVPIVPPRVFPMRPTLLALASLIATGSPAGARESLVVPAVSVELTYGGEGKLTVDGKVTKLTGEQATQLRADLAPLHPETLSRDLAKVQDLEAAAAKASGEADLRQRAVEREQDRIKDQEKVIASLEKRQKEYQDELNEATERNYNTNLDNLRAKLNAVSSSLASERKELERAKERLALATKRQAENAATIKTSTEQAAALRKALTERVEKVNGLLKAAQAGLKTKG